MFNLTRDLVQNCTLFEQRLQDLAYADWKVWKKIYRDTCYSWHDKIEDAGKDSFHRFWHFICYYVLFCILVAVVVYLLARAGFAVVEGVKKRSKKRKSDVAATKVTKV